MSRLLNGPTKCPHCCYAHWQEGLLNGHYCRRCKKSIYESDGKPTKVTVVINGRHRERTVEDEQ